MYPAVPSAAMPSAIFAHRGNRIRDRAASPSRINSVRPVLRLPRDVLLFLRFIDRMILFRI